MRDGLTDLSGAGTIPQHTGYDEAPGWISQPGACPFLSSSKKVPLLRHIWPDARGSQNGRSPHFLHGEDRQGAQQGDPGRYGEQEVVTAATHGNQGCRDRRGE